MSRATDRGAKGLCPACGQGKLFSGFLAFHDKCEACGEDFRSEDAGDGPAFVVLTATSFLIVPLALLVHFRTGLNMVATVVLFGLLITGASLLLLRPLRGLFFAQAWERDAREATRHDIQTEKR